MLYIGAVRQVAYFSRRLLHSTFCVDETENEK